MRTVRFSPWYPLANAAAHAPAGENVLQLRVADGLGLIDYPRGKSAMVRYVHAGDARAEAIALAAAYRERVAELWCRHLEDDALPERPRDVFARVHGEFVRRFGAPPRDEAAP